MPLDGGLNDMATKTVFITGAGRGIGLELAKILVQQGHKVVASSRTLTPELKSLGCETFQLDVRAEMNELRDRQASLFENGLDLLINNAGTLVPEGGLKEVTSKSMLESFEINTLGPLKVTQALLPSLLRSSQPVVASITSKMGSISDNSSGGYYSYRISKAALNMFNKSFSLDFPQTISVVLHPGWVQTRMGGTQAPVSAVESASGLLKVIAGLSKKDSGRFFDFKGQEIPW
jgi:NAD(P)-dependent dehydrogenase (short-subunit alcohol dehydrogenase family)